MDEKTEIVINDECKACKVTERIPQDRVLQKLDAYFAADDFAGAERHLLYWLAEAEQKGDDGGLLLLTNECIGYYRKSGDRQKAFDYSERALSLAKSMGLDGTVTMATTYINAATARCAFEDYAAALPFYESAKELYERLLSGGDARLGGLYNNMALCVMALGDTGRARALYNSALDVMKNTEGGEASVAITYCNLADLVTMEKGEIAGEAEINDCLERAMEALDSVKDRRDGNYAYACEKCAPAFGHYGFFAYENELNVRARSIYEGN